jgi:hypothetical protein
MTFTLHGSDARVKYSVKGSGEFGILYMYVYSRDGGDPIGEISVDGSDSGETYLYPDEGEYYIEVGSANCSWSFTVEELR